MRVKVQPLRHKGRNLHREELKSCPSYVGDLLVAEYRDPQLGRPVRRARLLDITSGTNFDVLRELCNVELLWAKNREMRFTGYERIDGTDFIQTWSVEVA